MWDLIVSVPDHCLSFYFSNAKSGCCKIYLHFIIICNVIYIFYYEAIL